MRFQCASSSSRSASAGRPTAAAPRRSARALNAPAPPDRSPRPPACRPGNTAAAAASSAWRPCGTTMRALAERPDAGDGAEQRRLARARRSGDQHAVAGRECEPSPATSGLPSGRLTATVVDLNAGVGRRAARPRRPAATPRRRAPASTARWKPASRCDHRAPFGELAVDGDEERQRALHAAEGRRGLHQPAELDRAREIGRADHHVRETRSRPGHSRR